MINAIRSLLRSRKFVILVSSLIVAILVALIPDLSVVKEELIVFITVAASTLIGGIALEDAANAGRERAVLEAEEDIELDDIIREVIDEILIQLTGEPGTEPAIQKLREMREDYE